MKKLVLCLSLCLFSMALLPGCSDHDAKLSGGYTLRFPSWYNMYIVDSKGSTVVDACISYVAFDHNYIVASRYFFPSEAPQEPENMCFEYFAITLATGERLGPMDQAALDSWYDALGREEPLVWVQANYYQGLLERFELLYPGEPT